MHVVTLTTPVDTGERNFGVLQPGEWLMQNDNAFQIALMAEQGTVSLKVIPYKGSPLQGRSLLLIRSGAIGDLLLLSAAVAAYKKRFPDAKVALCCREKHFQIFENTDLFDQFIPYPFQIHISFGERMIIPLEGIIESTHTANDAHATDAFAQCLGIAVEDYKPVYMVTDGERLFAASLMTGKRPKVGMQILASTKNRCYPGVQWAQVILGLVDSGWEVFILGEPNQIAPFRNKMKSEYIHNVTQNNLSLRESVAMLSLCDAFVGVDSAFIHFCHALDVPAVGLYGPFSWKTRTAKAPLTHALTGAGDCAGCGWHVKIGQHFPPNKPCSKIQKCVVLADIKPERIISAVDKLKP